MNSTITRVHANFLAGLLASMKLSDLAFALDKPLESFKDAAIAHCNQTLEPMAELYNLVALAEAGEPMPWDEDQ